MIPDTKQWVVLIVDDEQDSLTVAEAVLKLAGAEVHTATDGKKALALLEIIRPTAILTDLSMPTMDGWKLLKAVRENPAMTRIPVVALTAHAMQGDRERVIEAGFNGYIAKPFWIESFMADLRQCLEQAASAAPGDRPEPEA